MDELAEWCGRTTEEVEDFCKRRKIEVCQKVSPKDTTDLVLARVVALCDATGCTLEIGRDYYKLYDSSRVDIATGDLFMGGRRASVTNVLLRWGGFDAIHGGQIRATKTSIAENRQRLDAEGFQPTQDIAAAQRRVPRFSIKDLTEKTTALVRRINAQYIDSPGYKVLRVVKSHRKMLCLTQGTDCDDGAVALVDKTGRLSCDTVRYLWIYTYISHVNTLDHFVGCFDAKGLRRDLPKLHDFSSYPYPL